MQLKEELQKLLDILPIEIRQVLEQHPLRDNLIEEVMNLGRRPEARFPEKPSIFPLHQFHMSNFVIAFNG